MHLLVDIGGTNTRLAWSDDDQTFHNVSTFKTPTDAAEGVARLIDAVKQEASGQKLGNVVIGIPGVIDHAHGLLTASPNLPGWIGRQLKQPLEQQLGAPVHLVNDAVLAGLGESVSGAGRNYRIVAYLTISTGVGGARFVDGRLDLNAAGFEPGQMIIDASGSLCPGCPKPTTLEHLVGGASVERRYHQPPKTIRDPRVWETAAQHLALGLNNVIILWSPHAIILGGPMMNDVSIKRVNHHLAQSLTIHDTAPPVLPAALPGETRAFYGALAYLHA